MNPQVSRQAADHCRADRRPQRAQRQKGGADDQCGEREIELHSAEFAKQESQRDQHIGQRRHQQRTAIDRQSDQPEHDIDCYHRKGRTEPDIVAIGHADQREHRMGDHGRGKQVQPEGDVAAAGGALRIAHVPAHG